MYRRFNKFFNKLNKSHTDYGPRQYFQPTLGEENTKDELLFITKDEKIELAIGQVDQAEFIDRVKFDLLSIDNLHDRSCGQISASLNKLGSKTARGNSWSSRLVMIFTRKYTNLRPLF